MADEFRASVWRDPVTERINIALARHRSMPDDEEEVWEHANDADCTTRTVTYDTPHEPAEPTKPLIALTRDEASVIAKALFSFNDGN